MFSTCKQGEKRRDVEEIPMRRKASPTKRTNNNYGRDAANAQAIGEQTGIR